MMSLSHPKAKKQKSIYDIILIRPKLLHTPSPYTPPLRRRLISISLTPQL